MPFHLSNNNEAVVSASVGITIAPNDGDSVELLLKNADTAMYQAKAAGRNTFQFFIKSMNEAVSKRMYIEQALRQAIKQKEFYIALSTRGIYGKWRNCLAWKPLFAGNTRNKGLIYPDDFIEISGRNRFN